MNILNFISGLFLSKSVEQGLDIILEKTEDVDKRNQLFLEYTKIKEQTKQIEMQKITIPWVDALHKMGRQIFWGIALIGCLILIGLGRLDDLLKAQTIIEYILGGGGIYTILKGRGK